MLLKWRAWAIFRFSWARVGWDPLHFSVISDSKGWPGGGERKERGGKQQFRYKTDKGRERKVEAPHDVRN